MDLSRQLKQILLVVYGIVDNYTWWPSVKFLKHKDDSFCYIIGAFTNSYNFELKITKYVHIEKKLYKWTMLENIKKIIILIIKIWII